MNNQSNIKAKKATIYVQAGMMGNIIKIQVREIEVLRKKWAQYKSAVCARFLLPRKRHWSSYNEGYHPYLIVLEGWNHPNLDSPWVNVEKKKDCTTSQARHSFCSDGWSNDFDAKIDAYLEANPKVKVLGDYRYTKGLNTTNTIDQQPFENQQIDSVHQQLIKAGVDHDLALEAAVAYVKKSANMSVGLLNDCGQYNCTVIRGEKHFEAIYLDNNLIEPEDYFTYGIDKR